MSSRLDVSLKKHPEHEEGIRLLATRDPSGKLKYLEWGVRMLVAKQALAPEIADIIELFRQFNGRAVAGPRRRRGAHAAPDVVVRSDIHTYRPQDLARLRDNLHGMAPEYLNFKPSHRSVTSRRKATQSHHSSELIYVRRPGPQ